MGPERILICEDEGLTALRLRASLERLGFAVAGDARSGGEAVEKAVSLKPDAILMDVRMPELDGIEATRRIMAACPTAIVMVTAHSDEELIRGALDAGAVGYLVKPVVDEQLRPALTVAWARFQDSARGRREARVLQEASLRDRELAEQARERAAEAQRLTRELRTQLRQERDVARALAESFLCAAPEVSGLDIATRYEPASRAARVGGDYFDFIDVGDGRLGIVIGDVCGKGTAAAGYTAMARHMLRAYAAEDPTPARALERLNRALWQRMSEECAFLSMAYGLLDPESGEFVYVNAGHPPPVLCDPGASECEELAASGCVLGILPDVDYEQQMATLPPGGALVFYTDGVSEARSGGEMLGVEGVREVVGRAMEKSGSEAIAASLLERARTAAGGELKDDIAVIVVRRGVRS